MWPFSRVKRAEGRKHDFSVSLCAPLDVPAGSATCPRHSETPLLVGVTIPSLEPFYLLPAPFFPSDVFSYAPFIEDPKDPSPWIHCPLENRRNLLPMKWLLQWRHPQHPASPSQTNPVAIASDCQGICLATLSASLAMTMAFWPKEHCSL